MIIIIMTLIMILGNETNIAVHFILRSLANNAISVLPAGIFRKLDNLEILYVRKIV